VSVQHMREGIVGYEAQAEDGAALGGTLCASVAETNATSLPRKTLEPGDFMDPSQVRVMSESGSVRQ